MVEMEATSEINIGFVLTNLRRFIDGLELDFARFAAEFAQTEQWDDEGFNTPADWIRFNCHMNSHSVWNALAVGKHEAKLAESTQAMRSGEIGFAHLATLGRTAAEVGKVFDETRLRPLAKEHTPGKFHHKVLHYRHSLDAREYNDDQERQAEERSLRLGTAQDGCLLINGVLDPVGGAVVRTAVESLAKPSGEHDDRTREQRLADAVVELASVGKPANLQITATIETLKRLVGAAAGEMDFSLPLSSTSIQRIACDCSVTRVILSQESLPIDVARSRRVISGAVSKALKARDGHCRWPGCERPASWCDGHHLVHWIHGGPTDLDNLVLLCRRHHRMVHEGGWKLIKTEDEEIVTIAPTITFGLPRGPD
jgi:hypothetical protein